MPPVKIAPAIRQAIRRVTAKETIGADRALRVGKFWAPDSDSECEDLGDADSIALRVHPPLVASPATPSVEATAVPVIATGATPLPGTQPTPIQPPWRNVWKGPLPPP